MTTQPDSTGAEPFAALGRDVAALVRQELDQLRSDLSDAARDARTATVMLGAAGAFGALAAGTSAVFLVRTLDKVLPRPLAALVATGLYGTGAAMLTRLGLAELRRARREVASSASTS
jgi:hypothetical protein